MKGVQQATSKAERSRQAKQQGLHAIQQCAEGSHRFRHHGPMTKKAQLTTCPEQHQHAWLAEAVQAAG